VPSGQFQQLQAEKAALSDQLARATGELDSLRREVREAGASSETKLQRAVAAAVDAEASKHRRELASLRAENERILSENRAITDKLQSGERALATSVPAERLQILEAEKIRLTNELRRTEQERDQIQARSSSAMLAAAENERQQAELTAQVRDLQGRLAAAQQKATTGEGNAAQLQNLEREKAALVAEVKRLRSAESQLATTSTQTAELNRRVQELSANSDRLAAQNRDLEAQLNLAKQAVATGSASAADLRRLENEKATLVAELTAAKQALATASASTADLRRLETEKATLTAELNQLKAADAQRETQIASAASQSAELNRRVQELSANSERLASRNRELETQVNMAKQAVALTVPVADYKRLEAQHETLTAELTRSKQTIDGLQATLAKAESTQANTVRELQARIASAVEVESAKARAQVDEARAQVEQLLANTQQLTAQNRDLAAQVQTLRGTLAASVPADRLKELEAEKALAQAELDRARNESALQLQIAEQKANKASSELTALSRQIEQLSSERQQLVSDNLALNNQVQLAQLNLAASVPADELKRIESEKALLEMNLKRMQLEHDQAQARLAEASNASKDQMRQLDELRANSNRLLSENRDLAQRIHAQEVALAAAPLPETVKKLESEKALLASALERAKREHDLYRQLSEARAAAAQAATALASHHRNDNGGDEQLVRMLETLREQNLALRQKNDRLSAMALEMANMRAAAASNYATGSTPGSNVGGHGNANGSANDAEALRRRILELERQLLEERVTTTRYGN